MTSVDALFQKYEKEIVTLGRRYAQLDDLRRAMKTQECFDSEDEKMMVSKLAELAEAKKHFEIVLAKKKAIYESSIQNMEQHIQTRQQTLESFEQKTQFFQNFPDVLEFFVRKQGRLSESLQDIKRKLAE